MIGTESGDSVVSVVTRSHDERRLAKLERALFSVYSQDFSESVELLVVTSGYRVRLDSDVCVAHLGAASKAFQPAGPRRFRHVRMSLQGDTRARLLNIGLQEATGAFIYFLDDDDVLRQNALRRLVGKSRETGANLVFGRVDLVVDFAWVRPERRRIVPYSTKDITRLELLRHNTAPLCSYLIKHPRPRELPLVPEDLRSLEDYAMLIKTMQSGKIASLDASEAVAEYWLDSEAKSQAEKYAVSAGKDLSTIEELKRSLTFQFSGEELLLATLHTPERQAFATLLAAIPTGVPERIGGAVEQIVHTSRGTAVFGWAAYYGTRTALPPILFAVRSDCDAELVNIRFPRPDVVATRRLPHSDWGFAYFSRVLPRHFIAIAEGAKAAIPLYAR